MVPLRPSAHGPHRVARLAPGQCLANSAAAFVLIALILTTTLLGGCTLFRSGSPVSGGSPGDPSGGTDGQPGDPAGGDTTWIDAGSSPFPVRGVIEGFYGQPWTWDERLSALDFMSNVGFNTYVYAPKNDAYQREKWRARYPEDQLAHFETLMAKAAAGGINFVYSINHPQLILGPLRGRAADLASHVAGYLLNPMNQEEASKLPLYTAAAYLADPYHYDPEVAWREAAGHLVLGSARPVRATHPPQHGAPCVDCHLTVTIGLGDELDNSGPSESSNRTRCHPRQEPGEDHSVLHLHRAVAAS